MTTTRDGQSDEFGEHRFGPHELAILEIERQYAARRRLGHDVVPDPDRLDAFGPDDQGHNGRREKDARRPTRCGAGIEPNLCAWQDVG